MSEQLQGCKTCPTSASLWRPWESTKYEASSLTSQYQTKKKLNQCWRGIKIFANKLSNLLVSFDLFLALVEYENLTWKDVNQK